MPSSMTKNPNVVQKSLRIQSPSVDEGPVPATPPLDRGSAQMKPRSILKNREESPTPTTTDVYPLQCESYFQGPLRTIIASAEEDNNGRISVHDTTEAYILLSCRIEAQAHNLEDEALPAVASLQNLRSLMICTAIHRDVSCAISGSQEVGGGPSDQGSLTEEERSRVRDQSGVCHAALRFLANLFRFPSLHRALKPPGLTWILKELLDVGLSGDLLTLNPQKTYGHVICILTNQRLPDSVLRPLRSKIATVIERAATGILGGTNACGPHVDGLRAVYANLHQHGSLLIPEFERIFKVVLQNLVCPISTFRDLAAKALSAFAHVVLRGKCAVEVQVKFSSIVGAFIDKELQRAKDAHKRDPNAFVLRDYLKLSENDPRNTQRVAHLLNIISALLVLSGPCVFVRPNSLKFLIKAIGKTQAFRQRELNLLRAATWSCLVRAYSLLSTWDIPSRAGLEENAFRIVCQEYREDVGISVVAVLLETLEGTLRPVCRIQEAATYLYHLGQMPETRNVTIALLRRLLGGVLNDADSETCTWTGPESIVPEWLSNGSTLGMEPRRLRKVLASVGYIDLHAVRILEADELISNWDSLVEAFQICAIGRLFDKKAENLLQGDILLLWQALLRVQSALADDFSRETVSKSVLSCLATTLCAILDATQARFPIRPGQAVHATHQLWKSANDELGELWGAALAGSIYRRLFKIRQFEVTCILVADEWVQLSRSLIYAAPQRTLEVLRELYDVDIQRVIWLDMVRHVRFKERPSKEVILHLLWFPLQMVEQVLKDEIDFSYWDMLFLLALMHEEPETVYTRVSEQLERALSVRSCTELRKFFLASVSHMSRWDAPPNLNLLSITSEYLGEAYPPEDCEENELIELIPSFQRILHAKCGLPIIKALEKGLIPWFEDKKSYIRDITYNNDILPFYCDLFQPIHHISPIEDAVVELAELLAAPFSRERIPEPAIGPVAFKEFWDSVGPTLDFGSRNFPPILADCVICLAKAYGGYVPDWMESQLDSLMHSSEVDDAVPPSVEDLESSDLSLLTSKRNRDADGAPRALDERMSDKAPLEDHAVTPIVSPSLGIPTPQFARYRRDDATATPAISLNLARVRKKRKLRESNSSGKDGETTGTADGVDSAQKTESQESHLSPGDYSSWEVRVSSQDVRKALQGDDDETVHFHRVPSPVSEDDCFSDSTETPEKMRRSRASAELEGSRSRTAPASLHLSTEGHEATNDESLSSNPKLRRMHTTTEVPLDALEKLHAQLSADANYMQTQDLAQATKLTYDVLGILNGKMSEKLENRK